MARAFPMPFEMNMETKPQPNSIFLDLAKAAEVSGFSLAHFRRIVRAERIQFVQIGRKYFILRADLERWRLTGERRSA